MNKQQKVTIQFTIPADWDTDGFVSEVTGSVADAIGDDADIVEFEVMS